VGRLHAGPQRLGGRFVFPRGLTTTIPAYTGTCSITCSGGGGASGITITPRLAHRQLWRRWPAQGPGPEGAPCPSRPGRSHPVSYTGATAVRPHASTRAQPRRAARPKIAGDEGAVVNGAAAKGSLGRALKPAGSIVRLRPAETRRRWYRVQITVAVGCLPGRRAGLRFSPAPAASTQHGQFRARIQYTSPGLKTGATDGAHSQPRFSLGAQRP